MSSTLSRALVAAASADDNAPIPAPLENHPTPVRPVSLTPRPGESEFIVPSEKPNRVQANSYYLIECPVTPLAAQPYTDFVWKVIGRTGSRALCIPAYDFRAGRFVEDEAQFLANFVIDKYLDASGIEVPAANFQNVDFVMTDLRVRMAAGQRKV